MSLTYQPREFFEGAIYTFLNDKEKAVSAFERARPIAEKALRESPDDASRHVTLGFILAGLGEKNAAIAEGKRAVELLPESQDALRRAKDDRPSRSNLRLDRRKRRSPSASRSLA